MRFLHSVLLSLITSYAPIVCSWDCTIQPQILTLKNSSLLNGVAKNRGIQLTLPGDQVVGLRFSWFHNNTLVRDDVDCSRGNTSEIQACEGASGSTFDSSDHAGWTRLSDSFWKAEVQTLDPLPTDSIAKYGMANILFDDGPNVTLPIAAWNNPALTLQYDVPSPFKSVLGMGLKSDLLQTFLNASIVPSKFMGLFFGSRSVAQPVNGELLIGGWNQSRVREPWVNYTIGAIPMSIPCALAVKVRKVVLNNDRGSHPMIDEGQTVSACIDALQNQLTFTDQMYSRWSNATEHPMTVNTSAPYTDQTYPAANEHLIGDLYIELEGGYNTTVSHIELVSAERGPILSDLGEYAPLNNGRIMASVGRGLTNYGQDFGILLGRVFLASTYVFVDYENMIFGLAPAVFNNTYSDVRTQCSKDTSISPSHNATGTVNTTPISSEPANSSSTATSLGLSASDKIALGVGIPGGVAGIATLIWMIWIYLLEQRGERKKSITELSTMPSMKDTAVVTPPMAGLSPNSEGVQAVDLQQPAISPNSEGVQEIDLQQPAISPGNKSNDWTAAENRVEPA